MGRSDIQVIPVPKAELLAWWDRMSKANKDYVRARIGYLVDLIRVECQISFIEALAHFWNPNTSTFDMGGLEITPTLEEYNVAIGVDFKPRLVEPPVGLEPSSVLAEFLDTNVSTVEKVLKSNMGVCPLSFLLDKFSRLPAKTERKSARAFILAFFGFVLFPTSKNAFDPLLAHVARQACLQWDYSYMILAETFLSLNRFRSNQKGVFRGPAGFLYMWFTSHIKDFGLRMNFHEISEHVHPFQSFVRAQANIPRRPFRDWRTFLSNLEPKQLRWRLRWPRLPKAWLTCNDGDPVPLLGFTGGTAYYPLRVVRQFGALQEVPPPPRPNVFYFDLPSCVLKEEDKDYFQTKIRRITQALKSSSAQNIEWPDVLDGETETHRASMEYIRHFKE